MARGILNAVHTQGKIPLIQSNCLTDQKRELVLGREVLFDDLGGLAYIALKLHFGQIQPYVQILVLHHKEPHHGDHKYCDINLAFVHKDKNTGFLFTGAVLKDSMHTQNSISSFTNCF